MNRIMYLFAWILAVLALTGCSGVYAEGTVGYPVEDEAAYRLDIPRGHYPPPGKCRIWYLGLEPGQQPPPGECRELFYQLPPGAILIRGK